MSSDNRLLCFSPSVFICRVSHATTSAWLYLVYVPKRVLFRNLGLNHAKGVTICVLGRRHLVCGKSANLALFFDLLDLAKYVALLGTQTN